MTALDERAVIMGMTATARSSSAAPTPLSPAVCQGVALTYETRQLIRRERDRARRQTALVDRCGYCLAVLEKNPQRPQKKYCDKTCANRAWESGTRRNRKRKA